MLVVGGSRSIQVILQICLVAVYSLVRRTFAVTRHRSRTIVRAMAPIRFPRKRIYQSKRGPTFQVSLILPALLFLLSVSASINAFKFEAIPKGKFQNWGHRSDHHNERGFMNLSVETKVAIAVATSFVVLIVGAMAQG
jgi:hypothetical protein